MCPCRAVQGPPNTHVPTIMLVNQKRSRWHFPDRGIYRSWTVSVVKQFQLGKTCDQPVHENVVSNGEIFNSSLSRSGTYIHSWIRYGSSLWSRFVSSHHTKDADKLTWRNQVDKKLCHLLPSMSVGRPWEERKCKECSVQVSSKRVLIHILGLLTW